MTSFGNAGSTAPLFVAGIGLLGLIFSPVAEVLIAKFLLRVGGLPPRRIRMTTAVITGILSAAFAFRFGADPGLPAFILLAVMGVQLARIDIAVHLLPNPLVLFLLSGGFSLLLVSVFAGSGWVELLRAVTGASVLFVLYLILALISPGALGMGDVKLAAPLGLYLGYLGWTQLLYGGLLGFALNGVVILLVLARMRGVRASEVAHGPSMFAAATVVALVMFQE